MSTSLTFSFSETSPLVATVSRDVVDNELYQIEMEGGRIQKTTAFVRKLDLSTWIRSLSLAQRAEDE